MADQTSVSGPRSNGNAEGVVGSIAGLGNDIASLVELQAKLAMLDLKEAATKAAVPLALVAGSLIVAVGSVPVAVAGVGLLVARALAISPGLAILLTAAAFMIVASTIAGVAGARIPHCFESFRRSREEFVRNVAWLRTVLVHSGRAAPRRRF